MIRVVSLVPSLTETVARTAPRALIGATAWCTHPEGLDVPRVGGPKSPDLAMIRDLHPDLVLMSVDENRWADAEALRSAGIAVHATHSRDLDTALSDVNYPPVNGQAYGSLSCWLQGQAACGRLTAPQLVAPRAAMFRAAL